MSADLALERALAESRAAFPDAAPLEQMTDVLMVVLGDLARISRSAAAGRPVDATARCEAVRELGNLALSALRFVEDLGYSAADALNLAGYAHQQYARRMENG